jgi:hypothetical protein
MLRNRHVLHLLSAVFLAALLLALPAGVHAHALGGACPDPNFIGLVNDEQISFRYPNDRDAAHITAGTYNITIRDLSTVHNYHLRSYSDGLPPLDLSTSEAGTSEECWTVTFAVGDYEYKSDADPDNFRGLVTAHAPIPPPPPPPPPNPAGPPPPPAPPPPPELIGTVGPAQQIALFFADGRRVDRLAPGTYSIQIHDLSASHNFHLTGPGVDQSTEVADIVHPIWRVTVTAGTYRFKCDVHAAMKGSFVVGVVTPPPVKCRVPRLVGKSLGPARRSLRVAHCSVGRLSYVRSPRARGKIVRQRPLPGRRLARGSPVNLVVSRGPG